MIPLYTSEEFQRAKSKDLLPLQCKYCGKTFERAKKYIKFVISPKNTNGHTRDFCSSLCSSKYNKPSDEISVKCENCNKDFLKSISQIKKTKHNFCCQSCSASYNNKHKTKGTRRSKLEKWIEEQLTIMYPSLEFHFNRKDAINSELDIFIPSLHLAFELNGIFHYEPIYGQEKLDSVQTNDQRKFQACIEKGIEFCTIDTSSIKNFKIERAKKFLDIIVSIINTKLNP